MEKKFIESFKKLYKLDWRLRPFWVTFSCLSLKIRENVQPLYLKKRLKKRCSMFNLGKILLIIK